MSNDHIIWMVLLGVHPDGSRLQKSQKTAKTAGVIDSIAILTHLIKIGKPFLKQTMHVEKTPVNQRLSW